MERQMVYMYLLKQIHDGVEKQANNSLRSQGLTLAQVGALIELRSIPEKQLTLKELEKRLHVAQSTAAGIVARLGLLRALVMQMTVGLKCCASLLRERRVVSSQTNAWQSPRLCCYLA